MEKRMAYRRGRKHHEDLVNESLFLRFRVVVALSLCTFLGGHASAQTYVVRDGSAKSVIVLQNGAAGLNRRSAEELQKYIGQLTGVRPDIISQRDISGRPKTDA